MGTFIPWSFREQYYYIQFTVYFIKLYIHSVTALKLHKLCTRGAMKSITRFGITVAFNCSNYYPIASPKGLLVKTMSQNIQYVFLSDTHQYLRFTSIRLIEYFKFLFKGPFDGVIELQTVCENVWMSVHQSFHTLKLLLQHLYYAISQIKILFTSI